MTRSSLSRIWAAALLLCLYSVGAPARAEAQTDQTSEAQLLGKAHALEVRDRMDLAQQVWQQVLNNNPNQPDALAGMAHAKKLEGKQKEAQDYLNRLRAVSPNDPRIAQIEASGTARDEAGKLQEAGRLAQAGQYGRAMTILREVYGNNPPAGDAALSYYQTEAGSEEGRPHAIAGLRALADKYPQDARYQIALGKILTYNPRSRAEGRKLLSKYPYDPDAQQAMRQSLAWDQKSPGSATVAKVAPTTPMGEPVESIPAGQVTQAQAQPRAKRAGSLVRHSVVGAPPNSGVQASSREPSYAQAWRSARRSQNAEQRAAYAALNAKRLSDADARFRALLDKNPRDFQAAAGLGYVRMNQSNFGGAISFFEQAEEAGDRDPAVEKALRDSRFYYTMQTATAALNENNLPVAEQEFRAALGMRLSDPEALQGLGGTLLKAQQNERALEIFATFTRVAPGNLAAWRGLFEADYGAGRYSEALETDKRVPPAVKKTLVHDPDYLRTLASVYMAMGREGDAQRVLRAALDLPFPGDGAGLKVDVELQYAALLSAAGRKEQAVTLYRQVLAREPNNVNAWVGLVQNEHQLGQDAAAYEAIRTMPAESYKGAMAEAGFETSVAAVYEAQGHDELAQRVLEEFLATTQAQGKKLFAPAGLQLASIYMRRGESARAYGLYKTVLEENPNNADAWSGLLGALHATGHDTEAMSQLQSVPPEVRKELENNPGYLQVVGSIYASLGDSQTALQFFERVQRHYGSQHVRPPAELEVQESWLLYNSHADAELLRHLMALGDRRDLNDAQRLAVQTIWANLAVRRANQASAVGNYRLALAILNAAAKTFPMNQDVQRALAGGYAQAGMAREAVAMFKSQNLNVGSASDYRAAVGAALAANDMHDAEIWLRFGLDQYPNDAPLMVLAAKFETARGDANRAALYYRAALTAMPQADPGAMLAQGIAQPVPQGMAVTPDSLAALLAEPTGAGRRQAQPMEIRPYLPSMTGGTGMIPAPAATSPMYGTDGSGAMTVPGAEGSLNPGTGYTPGSGVMGAAGGPDMGGYSPIVPGAQSPAIGGQTRPSTLGDYKPHSRVEPMVKPATAPQVASAVTELHLHADKAMEAKYGPYVTYDPAHGVPHFLGTRTGLGDGVVTAAGASGTTATVVSAMAHRQSGESAVFHAVSFQEAQPSATETSQPTKAAVRHTRQTSKRAKAVRRRPVQMVSAPPIVAAPMFSPRPNVAGNATAADGTPIVAYAPNARPATRSANAEMEARAQAIRENQAAASQQMTGVSRPPNEVFENGATNNPAGKLTDAQYQTPYGNQYGNAYGGQVAQPGALNQRGGTSSSAPQYGSQPYGQVYGQQGVPQQGDSYGQQYPQPGTRGSSGQTDGRPAKRRKLKRGEAQTQTAGTPLPAGPPQAPGQPPMQYPLPGQPLENVGPPQVGSPSWLGQAPSDYQLEQHNLPPLRGYFDPRVDVRRPLGERAQAEFDLAQIEGSYSSWLGASAIGRYRSGTPGIDRLGALTVPLEASFVIDNNWRVSLIPKAVFLSSGQLSTNGGTLPTGPVLGTFLGTNPNNPQQQFASGVGGEVQVATNTFAAAIGFTPEEFLVTNLIGRGRWRPGNSHFTLYGGRDAVEETQLSYAGLRDPGTATPTYGGNVWGGVVQTGGGVRFDYGDERSGVYLQGEGAALTGYHVLQNQKADGLAGAYFRVKSWPEAGTLNIGATFYGMHFTYNERGESYGLGGYFSPEAYFLAAVPLTFTGHAGTDFHYTVNGSLGVQTFQEDNQSYFPLDPGLLAVAGCTAAQLTNRTCGLPVNSSTGLNFSFDSQVSYRVNEHWFVGGFLSANNTNNYDTVQGGFFARYTFRPQYSTADYPTGLFPVEGFRPLRVP